MTDETEDAALVEELTPEQEAALTPSELRFERAIKVVRDLAGKLRFLKIVLAIVASSLVIDLAITAWLGGLTAIVTSNVDHQHSVQDCRNAKNSAFFDAEKSKVAGQIKGWQKQITGLRAQQVALAQLGTAKNQPAARRAYAAYQSGGNTAIAGLQSSIDASLTYINTIGHVRGGC
jgi:hypothetical protein